MTTYFTEDHEWIAVEGNVGTVGITDYAQKALGDIVFVEVPDTDTYAKGDEIAVVESVKAASEIYAPVSGDVTEVNEALEDDSALVNSSAQTDGWFFKIELSDTSELEGLMDADGYKSFVEALD
jgi:glycine cleavage system H protein